MAIEGGLILLINAAALTANSLMCFVMYRKPRFHTMPNTFIVSLAMCHMFTACLVMPFTAGQMMAEKWPFGQVLCNIQGFAFLVLTWVPLQLLTIMAVNRSFKATQLALYKKWFSINRSIGMIMAIWVVDVAVLIFPIIPSATTFQFSPERSLPCSISFSYENQNQNITNTVITLALYVTLLIIAIIACCAIRRQSASILSSFQIQRRINLIDMKTTAEERKTNQVLFALITEVLLFWLPLIITKVVDFPASRPATPIPHQVHVASTFLWFAVPVLHPVTYMALYKPFSREVLRVLPTTRLRQNKVHAEHTT